jgi:2-oxoglutarate dehydrogenase E2 component (dihydrolipoamide succinyltransferase)
MSSAVKIPPLAESITEGVLVEWLKQDGEAVKVDQPIATLETDKAAVEIAADRDGVLTHVKKAGDTVAVGEVIATIDPGGTPTVTAKPVADGGSSPKGAPANGGLPADQHVHPVGSECAGRDGAGGPGTQ